MKSESRRDDLVASYLDHREETAVDRLIAAARVQSGTAIGDDPDANDPDTVADATEPDDLFGSETEDATDAREASAAARLIQGLRAGQRDLWALAAHQVVPKPIARQGAGALLEPSAFETGPARAIDFVGHALGLPARLGIDAEALVARLGSRMAAAAGDPRARADVFYAEAAPDGDALRALDVALAQGGGISLDQILTGYLCAPDRVLRHDVGAVATILAAARFRAVLGELGAEQDLALAQLATAAGMILLAGARDDNAGAKAGEDLANFARSIAATLEGGDVDPDHVADWQGLVAGLVVALAARLDRRAPLSAFAAHGTIALPEIAALRTMLPPLIAGLTPRLDVWGRDVSGRTSAPAEPDDSVDAELRRLKLAIPRIAKKTAFAGTPVNFRDWPEAYDDYVRRAGASARDAVLRLVAGQGDYHARSDGPNGGKAALIRATVARQRRAAQAAILADPRHAGFATYVRRQARQQQQRG
jgi:hypothetical protein